MKWKTDDIDMAKIDLGLDMDTNIVNKKVSLHDDAYMY